MIYLKREHLAEYKGLSKNLDTAFTYLEHQNLEALSVGRNEVDGEKVFINRMHYTSMPEEETFFEAHLAYIDIHIVLRGKEFIGVSDVGGLDEFDRDEASDFIGYRGEIECKCLMDTTNLLVVFPEDAHQVKMMCEEPIEMDKLVVKVKVT